MANEVDRARYSAKLNLAIQGVLDRFADRLSYAELIAGLAVVVAERLRDYARRTNG